MTSPTPTPPCLGEREAVARTGEDLTAEEIAEITAADPFCQPAPPSIPVRGPYYLTECEHCGWIGSSEQCSPDDEDVICPACLLSICGDGPSEADTAKHGEAVYQRIVTAEAESATLRTENETLRAERDAAIARAEKMQAVVEAAKRMPRETPAPGGAGTIHQFQIEAGVVWMLDRALLALTTPEHPHGD